MENEPMQNEKQNVTFTPSIFPPNSSSPESTSPAPPPPYSNPSQYPPTSGMPYLQYCLPTYPAMGYPQPCAPPPGGQPYYPRPGVVYFGPTGPNYRSPQSQQQQQQQVVDLSNQLMGMAPVWIARVQPVSMVGAIVLSCIVFWLCGLVFGGIAFILAMVGQSSAAAGDTLGAFRLRNASYGLSIAGIIIAVFIISAFIGVITTAPRSHY